MWLLKVPLQMFNQNINSMCLEVGPRVSVPVLGGWMRLESPGTNGGFCLCNYLTRKCNMCRISRKRSIRRGKVRVCHRQFSDRKYRFLALPFTCRSTSLLAARAKCKVCKLGRGAALESQLTSIIAGLPPTEGKWTRTVGSFSSSQIAGSGTVADRSTPWGDCVQINGILRGEIWKLPLMEHQW